MDHALSRPTSGFPPVVSLGWAASLLSVAALFFLSDAQLSGIGAEGGMVETVSALAHVLWALMLLAFAPGIMRHLHLVVAGLLLAHREADADTMAPGNPLRMGLEWIDGITLPGPVQTALIAALAIWLFGTMIWRDVPRYWRGVWQGTPAATAVSLGLAYAVVGQVLDYLPKLYPPDLYVSPRTSLILHATEEFTEVLFVGFLVLACAIYLWDRRSGIRA